MAAQVSWTPSRVFLLNQCSGYAKMYSQVQFEAVNWCASGVTRHQGRPETLRARHHHHLAGSSHTRVIGRGVRTFPAIDAGDADRDLIEASRAAPPPGDTRLPRGLPVTMRSGGDSLNKLAAPRRTRQGA
jgi:hypothetical protein